MEMMSAFPVAHSECSQSGLVPIFQTSNFARPSSFPHFAYLHTFPTTSLFLPVEIIHNGRLCELQDRTVSRFSFPAGVVGWVPASRMRYPPGYTTQPLNNTN